MPALAHADPAPAPTRDSEASDPRDRLLTRGADALTDAELLSLFLRTGISADDAHQLALDVLAQHRGLAGLVGLSPWHLYREGLGQAKAAGLLASVELARRFSRCEAQERSVVRGTRALARYLTLRYARRDQEVLGAVYVDCRGGVIADDEIYVGTLTRTSAEPREPLKRALIHGASGLHLFHTHPSGDPEPSPEDLAFTRRLTAAAEALGIRFLDHLVLGSCGRWVSLRERGDIDDAPI